MTVLPADDVREIVKATMVPKKTFEEYREYVEEELKQLKRRVRQLEKEKQQQTEKRREASDSNYNGFTLEQLYALVKCTDSPYTTAKIAMTTIFDHEDLKTKSISGKNPSQGGQKRPALNLEYVQVVKGIMKEKHPGISNTDTTNRMQAVLKAARLNRL